MKFAIPSLSINSFRLVYWVIALATSQHTAWGAATTMQGSQPEIEANAIWWWLQGFAFAAAIDYSMVMVATKIRTGATDKDRKARNWYFVTFIVVAIFSVYFQLLYAWHHSEVLATGSGVASEWVARLQGIIDARIIIAPFALPAIATLYTFGGIGKGGEIARVATKTATSLQQPSQSSSQPIAISAAKPLQLQAHLVPAIERRDANNHLEGYVCPGCDASLSVSGWSRHRKNCRQYLELSVVEESAQ